MLALTLPISVALPLNRMPSRRDRSHRLRHGQAYLGSSLEPRDAQEYFAAGVLAYRFGAGDMIEVLLGRQSLRQGRSRAGTWSFIGGKRDPGESDAVATAAREVHEESMGHMTANWVASTVRADPVVLWQPTGGYAVHIAELERPVGCGGVSDALAQLPTGEALPLRRNIPENDGSDTTSTLAVARSILDEHAGGPLLLARLGAVLYERLPASRSVVKSAGGVWEWCKSAGILTASGPEGTVGMETAWLAKADALEVDALLWLPWLLLQTRRDYAAPMDLAGDLQVKLNPYFARWVLRPRGADQPAAGELVRGHFDRVAARGARLPPSAGGG